MIATLLSGLYRICSQFYKATFLRVPSIPCTNDRLLQEMKVVVVGSLLAGGAGKTPLVAWLANHAWPHQRVAIVAHCLRPWSQMALRKVQQNDWATNVTDESLWLARTTGKDVYLTSDRWNALHLLQAMHCYDLILCDDGLEDPRLSVFYRIRIDCGENATHWTHLLPKGKCRSLVQDHAPFAMVLAGPGHSDADFGFRIAKICNAVGQSPLGAAHVCCGIAQPWRFEKDLLASGIEIRSLHSFADHDRHFARHLRMVMRKTTGPLIITEKDAVRLDPNTLADPRLFVAYQELWWKLGFDPPFHN